MGRTSTKVQVLIANALKEEYRDQRLGDKRIAEQLIVAQTFLHEGRKNRITCDAGKTALRALPAFAACRPRWDWIELQKEKTLRKRALAPLLRCYHRAQIKSKPAFEFAATGWESCRGSYFSFYIAAPRSKLDNHLRQSPSFCPQWRA